MSCAGAVKVDYFRAMSRDLAPLLELLNYFGLSVGERPIKGPGLYHYGWREDYDGALLLGGGREDMGYCLQLSGDVLARIGGRVRWAFIWCNKGLLRASRVDLCGHGSVKDLRAFERSVRKGTACKFMKRWQVIENDQGGLTVYAGSRKSASKWRCYDKGVESGQPEYAGVARLELQCEGENAARMAEWIGAGLETVAETFAGMIEGAFKRLPCLRDFAGSVKSGLKVHLSSKAVPLAGERLIRYVKRMGSVLRAFVDLTEGFDPLVAIVENAVVGWKHQTVLRDWRLEPLEVEPFGGVEERGRWVQFAL